MLQDKTKKGVLAEQVLIFEKFLDWSSLSRDRSLAKELWVGSWRVDCLGSHQLENLSLVDHPIFVDVRVVFVDLLLHWSENPLHQPLKSWFRGLALLKFGDELLQTQILQLLKSWPKAFWLIDALSLLVFYYEVCGNLREERDDWRGPFAIIQIFEFVFQDQSAFVELEHTLEIELTGPAAFDPREILLSPRVGEGELEPVVHVQGFWI